MALLLASYSTIASCSTAKVVELSPSLAYLPYLFNDLPMKCKYNRYACLFACDGLGISRRDFLFWWSKHGKSYDRIAGQRLLALQSTPSQPPISHNTYAEFGNF